MKKLVITLMVTLLLAVLATSVALADVSVPGLIIFPTKIESLEDLGFTCTSSSRGHLRLDDSTQLTVSYEGTFYNVKYRYTGGDYSIEAVYGESEDGVCRLTAYSHFVRDEASGLTYRGIYNDNGQLVFDCVNSQGGLDYYIYIKLVSWDAFDNSDYRAVMGLIPEMFETKTFIFCFTCGW